MRDGQDSLGGESKTLMVACVSCAGADASETLCTLNFAARVRNVTLGPAKYLLPSCRETRVACTGVVVLAEQEART